MGVTVYSYISPYSFLMSVIWFTLFVGLGLCMRKSKYPIKFSVIPLVTLLILSLVRMFSFITIPHAVIVHSEVIYPAVMSFFRFEVVSNTIFGFGVSIFYILIFVWAAVSLTLIGKYTIRFYDSYHLAIALTYDRDVEAEKVLHELVGAKKNVRVYRTFIDVPFTMGIKPYIFLPENIEFDSDELRTILRHEWNHVQSNDVYIRMVLEIICAIFWWNPLAYVLKNNIIFTQELRSDFFAVAERDMDFQHYIRSIVRVTVAEKKSLSFGGHHASLVNPDDEFNDRLATLTLHIQSRDSKPRILPYAAFYIATGALFIFSYFILLLPAHWESPDVVESAETFTVPDDDLIFRAEEIFLLDNGDDTFSLYVDGIHVWDRDKGDIPEDVLTFLIIVERE